jgi:23S rRNA (guanosine2251-2'-O)-methyltransferase
MEKLSLGALNRPSLEEFRHAEKLPVVLVLDNIRSALNVGSIFRTADAFALERILLCGITATPPHREILKTALGSSESVPWEYYPRTLDAVEMLKAAGYRVVAVEQATEKTMLHELALEPGQPQAFVFGNEVDGVDLEVLRACHGVVEIPQYGTKHSLNVAVAAGIVAWEVGKRMREGEKNGQD